LPLDKTPALLDFSIHYLLSASIVIVCMLLYFWQVSVEKNEPSDRHGNRGLFWVIEYLRDETTDCHGKSNNYLIELLIFEIRVGRLHLWGRKNSKNVFIRPKDFKSKHYVFELYKDQYRLRSLKDNSVIWGPTLIEREVKDRWPQNKPST
jgi:hypothetical protein